MAKISGLVLSTLLALVCLWMNISSFPNIVGAASETSAASQNDAEAKDAEVPALDGENSESEDQDAEPPQDADRDNDETDADQTIQAKNMPGASEYRLSASSESSYGLQPASISLSAQETAEEATAMSVKPQGGKYVSIPSAEVDATGAKQDSDARVVGVARARAWLQAEEK